MPPLRSANARLLNYVKEGGVLIVQYRQNFEDNYGPYPFSFGLKPAEGSRRDLANEST